MTPAILALYGVQWMSRLLYYVLLKLGRTREETFASFRQVILDMERLLVMRDNPPFAPPPLHWNEDGLAYPHVESTSRVSDTLSADDLGMLMLHIHECRTILWRDRRRFSGVTIRNVTEDLAELAGERGVSDWSILCINLFENSFLILENFFCRSGERSATNSYHIKNVSYLPIP